METVTIRARIKVNKKVEFFQTMESLKSIVRNYCKDIEIISDDHNNFTIRITFNGMDELERNFYNNNEFDILNGSVKSLSYYHRIKINEDILQYFVK